MPEIQETNGYPNWVKTEEDKKFYDGDLPMGRVVNADSIPPFNERIYKVLKYKPENEFQYEETLTVEPTIRVIRERISGIYEVENCITFDVYHDCKTLAPISNNETSIFPPKNGAMIRIGYGEKALDSLYDKQFDSTQMIKIIEIIQ